jgi:pimeloyl-ACP methyl ester carboxylesterase
LTLRCGRSCSHGDHGARVPAGRSGERGGRTPVVFIHGLWLLPNSWDRWADFFDRAGYAALCPDWPDDPETVEQARANPDVLAKKTLGQVADHTTEVIEALDKKPVVIGHSTGGLLAQMIAGRGLSAATVGDRSGSIPWRAASTRVHAACIRTGAAEPAQPRAGTIA